MHNGQNGNIISSKVRCIISYTTKEHVAQHWIYKQINEIREILKFVCSKHSIWC